MSDRPAPLQARIPADLRAQVDEAVRAAEGERVGERLREGDPGLWGGPQVAEVANRLGWLTIARRMLDERPAIEGFAATVAGEGVEDVVLLGMGGSSLAPEVLRRSFPTAPGHPRLHVLDSTGPGAIGSVGAAIDPARSLFVVSSKSGGTIEPLSLFAHFWSLAPSGERFVAITDPGSGLEALARERGFRHVFAGDPDIGGRYSALSPFGIVPGALMGVDVARLLGGADGAWETDARDEDGALDTSLPGPVWLGAALGALASAGRDKLTFLIGETLPGLGLWLEQLVAESTGKQGTGILPVAEEPVGAPGVYGSDRVFVHLPDTTAADGELAARAQALADAGHPLITLPTAGPEDLGRVFLAFELAVAVSGWSLSINPFDQPNVQQAKDATKRVLEGYESQGSLPEIADADTAQLRELLIGGGAGEYVALMAYAQPSARLDEAVAQLRVAIRAASGVTTTFGYGPRFLHSTGQFHKGGPPTGRFLQLLHDGAQDVDIPGAAYSFATLKEAQAIGDLQTLREIGRPAERVRLSGDAAEAVSALTTTIEERA